MRRQLNNIRTNSTRMSYMPGLNIGKGKNPSIGNPLPERVYSVDSLPANQPGYQRNLNRMEMNMNSGKNNNKSNNVKANNKSRSGAKTGGSKNKYINNAPGKTAYKDNPMNKPTFPAFPVDTGNSGTTTSKGVSDSGFGYDIGGVPSPTSINMIKDDTLFRNWNKKPSINLPQTNGAENLLNSYTKVLDVNFKSNITDDDYKSEWIVIFNDLYRDIIRNTNASKGAIEGTEIDNTISYIDIVSRLFTILYQYEVITSWNPASEREFNTPNRELAQKAATVEFLDYRTKMRECLRIGVLPAKVMTYIRWIYEYKRQNPMLESNTIAFRDTTTMHLINGLVSGVPEDIKAWKKDIDDLIENFQALDPKLGPILLDKVDCVNFTLCKDYMGNAHNSSNYDPEFNNIYRNRTVVIKTNSDLKSSPVGSSAILASYSDTPFGLSLCNLTTQIQNDQASLPLERAGIYTSDLDITTTYNHYYFTYVVGTLAFVPCGYWYENGDDSTFISDSGLTMSIPKGDTINLYYPSLNNIGMAKRYSMKQLFMS
jgi:hypothetical protein